MKNTIRVERAKKKMSQDDLAQLIGVTRQAVYSIENNKYIPSTVLALKMAAIFGCSVHDLFELEEGD